MLKHCRKPNKITNASKIETYPCPYAGTNLKSSFQAIWSPQQVVMEHSLFPRPTFFDRVKENERERERNVPGGSSLLGYVNHEEKQTALLSTKYWWVNGNPGILITAYYNPYTTG